MRATLLLPLVAATAVALAGCATPAEETADPTPADEDRTTTPSPTLVPPRTGSGGTPTTTTPATGGGDSCEGKTDCLLFLDDESGWKSERMRCIGESWCADEGQENLVLTLVLRNAGRSDLNLNPYNFKLYTANTALDPTFNGAGLTKGFDSSVNLRPGGTATGQVAFEVDEGEEAEKVCYEGYSEDFDKLSFCHDLRAGGG